MVEFFVLWFSASFWQFLSLMCSDFLRNIPYLSLLTGQARPTRLQTRDTDNQWVSLAGARNYSAPQIVQTSYGARRAYYSVDTGATCWRIEWQGSVKVELHRHSLMVWCSIWCLLSSLQTHFNLCSCRTVGHKVSRPYIITCTFTILCILISTFLDTRQTIQDWIAINAAARAFYCFLHIKWKAKPCPCLFDKFF